MQATGGHDSLFNVGIGADDKGSIPLRNSYSTMRTVVREIAVWKAFLTWLHNPGYQLVNATGIE